jgi:hypothetical protein
MTMNMQWSPMQPRRHHLFLLLHSKPSWLENPASQWMKHSESN